jgi:hypothetical protein
MVSMRIFMDSECLPNAEDWEKCFLYGLHTSKILVPIISIAAWESIFFLLFSSFFFSI